MEMIILIFSALAFLQWGAAEVTEQDLQASLQMDVRSLKQVTWKEWMAANPVTAQGSANQCSGDGNDYTDCCKTNSDCDASQNLMCYKGMCTCKPNYFRDENDTTCEFRAKKELGMKCTPDKHNCYAAFANCVDGRCVCKEGFVQKGRICEPAQFDCPYKTTFKSPVGGLWPCRLSSNMTKLSISDCPRGSWCVTPVGNDRPKFVNIYSYNAISLSNQQQGAHSSQSITEEVEKSYCCPLVPSFVSPVGQDGERKRVFADVCLYGKPLDVPSEYCPTDTHFVSAGIGAGPVCCPLPCLPNAGWQPIIRDGKCASPAI